MGNLAENIKIDLRQLEGKSADHVTHALKSMSGNEDGSMVDGLINLVDAFVIDKQDSVDSTKKIYGFGGGAVGILLTGAVIGGIHLYKKHKEKKDAKAEVKRIQEIMDEEVDLANKKDEEIDENKSDAADNEVVTRE